MKSIFFDHVCPGHNIALTGSRKWHDQDLTLIIKAPFKALMKLNENRNWLVQLPETVKNLIRRKTEKKDNKLVDK